MATTTKCMSKMLKKELYEYCKTLITENQKLQLFNNAQEQEINELKIKSSCTLPTIADNINRKTIDMLEKEIEELEELNTHERRNYWILSEKIHLLVDKINSLEKDLEYFQNKCEIMEKELIKEDDFSLTYEEGNMPIVVNEHGKSIGELQEDGEVIMYSEEED